MRSNRCLKADWDGQGGGMGAPQLEERGISSLEEYIAVREQRRQERDQLSSFLAREDVSHQARGWARSSYILRNGRLPFQCRTCWLLPGNCICSSLRRYQPKTKVVIHLHPDEWGKGSNTGSLCTSLTGCELLMKGEQEHDQRLQQLLDDPQYTTAVLWPGPEAMDPQELMQLAAERSGGRIVLVAIDATWDGARKMKSRYPPGTLMLKLPAHLALTHAASSVEAAAAGPPAGTAAGTAAAASETEAATAEPAAKPEAQPALAETAAPAGVELQASSGRQGADTSSSSSSGHHSGQHVSLFRPLRKYTGNAAENGRVSTVEAVGAALLALEGDQAMYDGLMYNLKLKCNAMRHQKHMPLCYEM